MITVLLILSVVVWLPLLFYQMSNRGFVVFLIWLFIAPVASNLINRSHRNPFFPTPAELHQRKAGGQVSLINMESKIETKKWFEPTRMLFVGFVFVLILNSLARKQHLEPLNAVEIGMLLFSLILLTSAVTQSINRIYSRRVVIDAFIVPFLAYFISRRLVTSETRLIQLNRFFIYMAAYLIVMGLIERMVHPGMFYRLQGPFREKHAIFITVALPFFVVLADTLRMGRVHAGKAMVSRGLRQFILLMAPVITVLTVTRGNWVGFLLGLGALAAMGGRLMNTSRKIIALGLILVLLPLTTISILILTPPEFIEGRVVGKNSIYGRLATWTVVWQVGLESPVLGIGLNNTPYVLYNTKFEIQGVKRYLSVHNSYLSLFVEQGIVGLLVYLAIVMGIMRMGLRLYRTGTQSLEPWWGAIVVAVMIAYLAPALFGEKLHTPIALLGVHVFALIGGVAGVYGRNRVRAAVYRTMVSAPDVTHDESVAPLTSGRNLYSKRSS